ncbi:MAG TPA: glycosyltransferase [Paraburkholderia sp.]|uniref:glycosyltransferase n=1 Tax=Paraburkholderia sp. TaxID=1926495 RepID=UPI002B4724B9|nr:glycosyltransferase [Paraburkholderia sp.]HKR45483.1 glycosyltransferase [Paraburkholderia sp.]
MQENMPHEVDKAHEADGQGALALLELERDYLLSRLARVGVLERKLADLRAQLASGNVVRLEQQGEIAQRDAEIGALAIRLARVQADANTACQGWAGAQADAARAQADAARAEAHARHEQGVALQVAAERDAVLTSRMWRATGPLRRGAGAMSPGQRALARQFAKLVYWALTPHRMPARLRFLRERNRVLAIETQGREHAASSAYGPSTPPPLAAVSRAPIKWFFVGDTLDWLKTHDQLTGVGKVTTELFFASLDPRAQARVLPCVLGDTPSGLAGVSPEETAAVLADKLGARSQPKREPRDSSTWSALAPASGDDVLFTGVVWNPDYARLFERLAAQGVGVNAFLYDIIPIEHPELVGETHCAFFVDWLTTTVTVAKTILVSSRSIRDKLLRWATLANLHVNARIEIVHFGANEMGQATSPQTLNVHAATACVALSAYVLSVGTIDKRKNQALLARLWVRLCDELGAERVPQLVLVGRDDLGIAALGERVAALIADAKIVVLQGLSDQDLAWLYQHCVFTAFPSLSEGYGLPVAESLLYGKVCVASDLECIREHAGDLPWYFRRDDEDDALRVLRHAIESEDARREAQQRIASDYRTQTWYESLDAFVGAVANRSSAPFGVPRAANVAFPGAEPVNTSEALAKAAQWCTADNPDVSILVINWNAGPLTLECVRQLWAHTEGLRYEIVIVDNGSDEANLAPVRNIGPGVRLIELGKNRFFGEANNIAAEASKGRYLCMLNNDAFVRPGWLTAMVGELARDPRIGAVGPLFLFPDGIIQEAGAVIDENGFPVRFGRGETQARREFFVAREVDYVSAAACVMPRELFMAVGGFDLAYEPAYYEDADLCFKVRAMGRVVQYCPEARVVHIEGAAANHNQAAQARRNALGDLNRDKFVSRWGGFLKSRLEADAIAVRERFVPPAVATRPRQQKTAVIYTPYALTPGGGERYILTMATVLSADYAVTLVTPHPYSNLRLRSFECEFGIDLSSCELMTSAEFDTASEPDLMIAMGNHIAPPAAARGKRSFFLCQFPFQLPEAQRNVSPVALDGYEAIITYSDYAKAHVFAALSAHQLPQRPIEVVYPPVQPVRGTALQKKAQILSVGRFFIGAHSKRHDLMIEAFRSLHARMAGAVELHLAGSSMPEPVHMDYLNRLRESVRDLPVHFHVNVSAEELETLYRGAAIYWHGAGLEADLDSHPERAEHFGMTVVEAMSAGCVPLAFNSGGPREIIEDGVSGLLYGSLDSLVAMTIELLAPQRVDARERMGLNAAERAAQFSLARFTERIRALAAPSAP